MLHVIQTGPEHYEEAARLLALAADPSHPDDYKLAIAVAASAHAKLAAVASYVERDLHERGYDDTASRRWRQAIGWPGVEG